MFNSSRDILYLVISFCIIWITVFLCWVFYYLVRILKDTSKIVEEFRVRLQSLSETVKNIGDKVEHMYGLLSLAGGGVGEFVGKFIKRKTKKMIDTETDKFDEAAKDAVDRAVEATAEKMRKISKKIKR
jgi:uncharacterized membrane protein